MDKDPTISVELNALETGYIVGLLHKRIAEESHPLPFVVKLAEKFLKLSEVWYFPVRLEEDKK